MENSFSVSNNKELKNAGEVKASEWFSKLFK